MFASSHQAPPPPRTRQASLRALQELFELRARQNGLRLAQRLNLLIPGRLPDLKVLHNKVTGLVELSVVVRELLEFEQDSLLLFSRLNQLTFSLRLHIRLVDNVLALLF